MEDPTATLHRGPEPPPLAARVRVLNARSSPASFSLRAGSCVAGAGAGADLVIADSTVSRTHVQLTLVPEGVHVSDLGSRNGTFYLGQRVQEITLGLGSRLTLGKTEIVLEPDLDTLDSANVDGVEYRGLIGVSPAMRRVFAMLNRIEGSLVTVLIEGESGVGKELVARAIHAGSVAAQAPLVTLNCGALARELVLSELFGHKKGAFTGAGEARVGAFEAASGGTLFLDEVGELPLDVQPALLRALEAGEVRRVGDTEPRHVNVRVIAATNRDLEQDVAAGRFRRDVFYRLAVVRFKVPPLRERPEDIAPLARHFAAELGLTHLPDDVLERLQTQNWPGNVRELANAIKAYVALGELPVVAPNLPQLDAELSRVIDPTRPYAAVKDELLHHVTRVYLELLIRKTGGNQSEAARIAELDRSYLGKLLVKHGVTKP